LKEYLNVAEDEDDDQDLINFDFDKYDLLAVRISTAMVTDEVQPILYLYLDDSYILQLYFYEQSNNIYPQNWYRCCIRVEKLPEELDISLEIKNN